ncbi:uncharacterized protein [Mytilus edulis]|uniref:uncharacterized protein n=1 Tax=Mytilus edulis TaxID=6550 RepID=UPI0039EDE858
MEPIQHNRPGQRTTLCINEAFDFLESAEYAIPEHTTPIITPCMRRAVSETGITPKVHHNIYYRESINGHIVENDEFGCHGNLKCNQEDENCNLALESSEIVDMENLLNKSFDKNSEIIINEQENGSTEINITDFKLEGDNSEEKQSKGDNNPDQNCNCSQNNLVVTKNDDCDSGCGDIRSSVERSQVEGCDRLSSTSIDDNAVMATALTNGEKKAVHIKNQVDEVDTNQINENNEIKVDDMNEKNAKNVDENNIVEKIENKVNEISKNKVEENGVPVKVHSETEVMRENLSKETLENTVRNDLVLNNGCNNNAEDEEEVVRLRPKSVTIPSPRRGTTQIVSDVFGFLKEISDDDDDKNVRRSSGYKSSNLPEEIPKLTENVNKLSGSRESSGDVGKHNKVISESSIDKGSSIKEVKKPKVRRQKSHKDMDDDQNSEDSSDEDTGIYNESFRNSCWICVDDTPHPVMQESIDEVDEDNQNGEDMVDGRRSDDVFVDNISPRIMNGTSNGIKPHHKRSDSTTTTASESEFKRSFQTRRKCFIQRKNSQQEYERMSCRVFDNERIVTLEKKSQENGFGLHILDTHPVIVSGVDPESPAFRAGVKEGQILLMVNGVSVLEATHDRIISLTQQSTKTLQIEVANADIHYIRDLQKPVISGYLYKQKDSTFLRSWKRRYCVMRQDNCLYYYKHQGDADPLGAIPMLNYTVSRHQDSSKEFCFKAEKYGAKTYYFSVENREDMARWVGAMNEASMASKKRKESWMDVTSHNVGLPALEVRKPECSGSLMKCARATKTWQKRYCVLKDACIYYYKNMYSPRAQGMAHLHGYTLHDSSKKFSFTLKPPEPQMKPFTFAADNETDKNRWVEALSKSIQRWIKVD